jgi:hypothetical protein
MPHRRSQGTIITSDDRARFANNSINWLLHNFARGAIRSVVIATVWSDGEKGGDYHLEQSDHGKMIKLLERVPRILRGDEPAPPYREN